MILIYAIAKLVEIKLALKRKIKEVNEAEKSFSSEVISNIRYELDSQLESIKEAIEVLEDAEENTIY